MANEPIPKPIADLLPRIFNGYKIDPLTVAAKALERHALTLEYDGWNGAASSYRSDAATLRELRDVLEALHISQS